jgi:nitrate reductase NapE component
LRWNRHISFLLTTFSDYAALAVAVVSGSVFVATFPVRPNQRLLWLAIYIPLLSVVLFVFSFCFIALVFQEGP